MRPLLTRDTAILEYAVSEEGVYLFVVTSPRDRKANLVLNAYLLPVKPAELSELSARFLQLLATKDQSSVQAARDLYDVLLKPAEEHLASKSKLIIVPDGVLWDVPFAAVQPSPDQYPDRPEDSFLRNLCLSTGGDAEKQIRSPSCGRQFSLLQILY